jgi:hypothetical protein
MRLPSSTSGTESTAHNHSQRCHGATTLCLCTGTPIGLNTQPILPLSVLAYGLPMLSTITVSQPTLGDGHNRLAAGMHSRALPSPKPADTPLYRAVQNHLQTFLALCQENWEEKHISPHAERALRAYPSCNSRRMTETAAHLVERVLPPLPVRQWVLSLPKRLRYYLQRDRNALNCALRIFLNEIERHRRAHSPGAGADARAGAVSSIASAPRSTCIPTSMSASATA